MVVVGDIAIIPSSSRSRSDFERDLEVEIEVDFEIDFRPGPELDNCLFVAKKVNFTIGCWHLFLSN